MPLFKRTKCDTFGPNSHLKPGNFARNAIDDDDSVSVRTYSTMATTGSNRGAGWSVDKYFYQRAGRWLESWASRIGLRFGLIPPFIIAKRIHDILYPDAGFWIPNVRNSIENKYLGSLGKGRRVTTLKGIDCLMKQLQYVTIVSTVLHF